MGLFEELDIAGAKDNPFEIPDNTYPCVLTNLTVKADKNGNMGMIFEYTIRGSGTPQDGLKVTEYKRLPSSQDAQPLDDAAKATAMSYIKQRLAGLGVPESQMNGVEKDDLVGIECYVTVKTNRKDGVDYVNVRNVSLTTNEAPATAGVGEPSINPFA